MPLNARTFPPPLRAALRPVYHAAYRCALRLHWFWKDHFGPRLRNAGNVPLPPARLRYRVGESANAETFIAVGESASRAIESAAESVGRPLETCETVLDFGCGCGRTLAWLIERRPAVEFHGADVDSEAIEWCRGNFPPAKFAVGAPLPPTPYADASFDLIYAISVFTHLGEEHHRLWLAELRRILRPSGILLITVHGERERKVLSSMQTAQLEAEGFLFASSRKLRGILPDWYQTTFQTREYLDRALSRDFNVRSYIVGGMGAQDVVMLQPKTAAGPSEAASESL
ncbi:MAG: methyltransferase domain-containing protein [Bryobacteraceae bacterium]